MDKNLNWKKMICQTKQKWIIILISDEENLTKTLLPKS